MKSTFKSISRESRKTFLMREQILTILGKCGVSKWLRMKDLVTVANIMGWTTPFNDRKRKATTHPYSKILSNMTDKTKPSYYVPNLEWRQVTGDGRGNRLEYRLVEK